MSTFSFGHSIPFLSGKTPCIRTVNRLIFIGLLSIIKMDIEIIRKYCMQKPGASESFPFDETTLVFKVRNKIFALLSLEFPHTLNLKCDPALALELRERYKAVTPGYHMNKKHWNSVDLDAPLTLKEIYQWIDYSYDLVAGGQSGKKRPKRLSN